MTLRMSSDALEPYFDRCRAAADNCQEHFTAETIHAVLESTQALFEAIMDFATEPPPIVEVAEVAQPVKAPVCAFDPDCDGDPFADD